MEAQSIGQPQGYEQTWIALVAQHRQAIEEFRNWAAGDGAMADAREIAKAILSGEWQLFTHAEHRLDAAFKSGDETAKEFWRSVFRELCGPLKVNARLDDVSWWTYETAQQYADGIEPRLGPEDGEKPVGP